MLIFFLTAAKKKAPMESPKGKIASIFTRSPGAKKKENGKTTKSEANNGLTTEEREAILADTLNSKLWNECLIVCDTRSKRVFMRI